MRLHDFQPKRIQHLERSTGFALFPNTAVNGTADVPKPISMKVVDDYGGSGRRIWREVK